jgi:hypothetical protein
LLCETKNFELNLENFCRRTAATRVESATSTSLAEGVETT